MTTPWLTLEQTAAYFDVGADTLRAAMEDTRRAGIEAPWSDHGRGRRHSYRFCAARLDAWWLEVHQWRASEGSAASGKSGGRTPTGPRHQAHSQPKPPVISPLPVSPRRGLTRCSDDHLHALR